VPGVAERLRGLLPRLGKVVAQPEAARPEVAPAADSVARVVAVGVVVAPQVEAPVPALVDR